MLKCPQQTNSPKMAKSKTLYVCTQCAHTEPRWAGKCPGCDQWNTLEEAVSAPAAAKSNRYSNWAGTSGAATDLRTVKESEYYRVSSGLKEFDRVLGGGVVSGSVTLIGGDPGIGKSTLLMQTLSALSATLSVAYVTGEESPQQLQARAVRLGARDAPIMLYTEVQLESILAYMEREKPKYVVIDSIQTIYSGELQSAPGSVVQVRECAAQLTRVAKSLGIAVFLVGHVTKDGSIAGPRVLEHIVDTVLYFEGDTGSQFRMLRALKNRFGAANELGFFSMEPEGLVDVTNPSSMFLTAHERPVSGSCVLAAIEGNRPILVEVQALVEDAPTPNPKRFASGLDTSRLQMLLAVLNKHAHASTFDENVYVKVVGGVRLTEPGAELPVLLAVHSSLNNKPLPSGLIAFGEVGLAGELRPVQAAAARLKEAARLGFTRAIVPLACKSKALAEVSGIEITYVSRVDQALGLMRELLQAA